MKSSNFPINARKQTILKAVVTDYVATAEPIGSQSLASKYGIGVKSATIRSEMAELADMGYLRQPHISAGRIPSDMGYRFYVDKLMESHTIPVSIADNAKKRLKPHRTEAELIIEKTCKLLSSLAHYTSVATQPITANASISHVNISRISIDKLLLVVVLNNGRILHELVTSNKSIKNLNLDFESNFLSKILCGKTIGSLINSYNDLTKDSPNSKYIFSNVMEFLKDALGSEDEINFHLEGASYIMQQPEFKDITRLELILSVLDKKHLLNKLFSKVYVSEDVIIAIGSEIPIEEMQECSFVATKYRIRDRVAGAIGVLGPTRMDYRRAISSVELMAQSLGDLLTEISVS